MSNRWMAIVALVLSGCVLCSRTLAQNSTTSVLLQKGIYLQETAGDLDGAIKVYREVAHMAEKSRANAAEAEYRLGICLEKKGQQEQAAETFRRVIREYPEQTAIVAQAREFVAQAPAIHIKDNPCQSLEDELQGDPASAKLQQKILDCYFRAELTFRLPPTADPSRRKELENARVEHLLWFIQHAPQNEYSGPGASVESYLDAENYVKIKHEWMRQVQAHPNNASVLVNAARFIDLTEQDAALALGSKAHAADPKNMLATEYLARLYERKMHYDKPEMRPQMAQQALALREEALEAMAPEQKAGLRLNDAQQALATDAFEAGDNAKAQHYAEELLQRASVQSEKPWHDDGAIHHANVILGRIALRSGNTEEAKNRLLAAGKISGSPSLVTFGPNMMLAQELLEKGQQDVVLQYFDECSVFWQHGKDKLDAWRTEVRGGSMPKFGGNLFY